MHEKTTAYMPSNHQAGSQQAGSTMHLINTPY